MREEAVTSRSRNGWQVKFGKLVPIWSVFPHSEMGESDRVYLNVSVCGTRANASGESLSKGGFNMLLAYLFFNSGPRESPGSPPGIVFN